jgi:DNA-binding transcriptional regulator YdaS (Cro superfamily)
MSALQQAIDIYGGPTKLAVQLGVSVQRLLNWLARGVPAERCPDIEDALDGRVTCEQLRPDVNWSVLRRRDPQPSAPAPEEQSGQGGAQLATEAGRGG